MKFPEIKKRVVDFFRSEKGSISKQSLIKLGSMAALTSFAANTNIPQAGARTETWGNCYNPAISGFKSAGYVYIKGSAIFKSNADGKWHKGVYEQGANGIDNPPDDSCAKAEFLSNDDSKKYNCYSWGHDHHLATEFFVQDKGELTISHTHDLRKDYETDVARKTANTTSSGHHCMNTNHTDCD
jgi:hypothetical protein